MTILAEGGDARRSLLSVLSAGSEGSRDHHPLLAIESGDRATGVLNITIGTETPD